MKILSIDVGIINLAYCVIESTPDDNFNICEWQIINLTDAKACCFINKNNKICNKRAKYLSADDKYACEAHKKKFNKLTHLQNSYKTPLNLLATKLFEILDTKPNLLEVDTVVIENQPTFLNPTMKTIAALLYGYFILRGIVEKARTKSNITLVKFISPSNKLKVNKETTNKTLKSADKNDVYNVTKNLLGKEYCKALIKNDDVNYTFLLKQEKQDDYCDAFLQGFHYLLCPNGVPEKYANILKEVNEVVAAKMLEKSKKKTLKKSLKVLPEEKTKKKTIKKSKVTPKVTSKVTPKVK